MADLGTLQATLGVDTSRLAKAGAEMRGFAARASTAMGQVSSAIFSIQGAIVGLAVSFGALKLKALVTDLAHTAGKYEMLGITVEVAGKNAGYTRRQTSLLEDSLREQGIAAIEARQVLTRLSAAQIDLSQASALARAAQDLAVVGAINSSEAYERLVHGIISGHALTLRTLGLNVQFEDSYEKLARQLGKNANALTTVERLQARVNIVLERAASYAGIYERSMESAEKQMGSLQRYIDNYKVAFGAAFQPAYLKIVLAMTEQYKEMTKVVSDPAFQEAVSRLAMDFAELYESSLKSIPVLLRFVKDLAEGFHFLWEVMFSVPTGMIEFFEELRRPLKDAQEQAEKLAKILKEIKPPPRTEWEKFMSSVAMWGRDIMTVFAFMGKTIGNIFALMASDIISLIIFIGREFVSLGNIIYYAFTLQVGKGVAELGKILVTNVLKHKAELQAAWDVLAKDTIRNWDKMYLAFANLPALSLPVKIAEGTDKYLFKEMFDWYVDEVKRLADTEVKETDKVRKAILQRISAERELLKLQVERGGALISNEANLAVYKSLQAEITERQRQLSELGKGVSKPLPIGAEPAEIEARAEQIAQMAEMRLSIAKLRDEITKLGEEEMVLSGVDRRWAEARLEIFQEMHRELGTNLPEQERMIMRQVSVMREWGYSEEEVKEKIKELIAAAKESAITMDLMGSAVPLGEFEASGDTINLYIQLLNVLRKTIKGTTETMQALNDEARRMESIARAQKELLDIQHERGIVGLGEFATRQKQLYADTEASLRRQLETLEPMSAAWYQVSVELERVVQEQERSNALFAETRGLLEEIMGILGMFGGRISSIFNTLLRGFGAFDSLLQRIGRISGSPMLARGVQGLFSAVRGGGGSSFAEIGGAVGIEGLARTGAGGGVAALGGSAGVLTVVPTTFAPSALVGVEAAVAAGTETGIAASGIAVSAVSAAAIAAAVVATPILLHLLLDKRRSPQEEFRLITRLISQVPIPQGIGPASVQQELQGTALTVAQLGETGLLPGPVMQSIDRLWGTMRTSMAAGNFLTGGDVQAAGRAWTDLQGVMAQFADNQYVQQLATAMGQLGDQIRPLINQILSARGTLAPPITPITARRTSGDWAMRPSELMVPRGAFGPGERTRQEWFEGTPDPVTLGGLDQFISDVDQIMQRAPIAHDALINFAVAVTDLGSYSGETAEAARRLAPILSSFIIDNLMIMDIETREYFMNLRNSLDEIDPSIEDLVLDFDNLNTTINDVLVSLRRQIQALAQTEEGQNTLQQAFTGLVGLNDRIVDSMLQLQPATLSAQLQAASDLGVAIQGRMLDPALTFEERLSVLGDAFNETENAISGIIGTLEQMRRESQAAGREAERLANQIVRLRQREEESRRDLAFQAFDIGLAGRPVPEAMRLRRGYMTQELSRLTDMLEATGENRLTGENRVRVAGEAQALAEALFNEYARDQSLSLEDIEVAQHDALRVFGIVNDQLEIGFREQVDPLRQQLLTQQDILRVNNDILTASFGTQTNTGSIMTFTDAIKQSSAQGFTALETIRNSVVGFGTEITTALAPLLGEDSPFVRQARWTVDRLVTQNDLLRGPVQGSLDASRTSLGLIAERIGEIANLPEGLANALRPLILSDLPGVFFTEMNKIFGVGGLVSITPGVGGLTAPPGTTPGGLTAPTGTAPIIPLLPITLPNRTGGMARLFDWVFAQGGTGSLQEVSLAFDRLALRVGYPLDLAINTLAVADQVTYPNASAWRDYLRSLRAQGVERLDTGGWIEKTGIAVVRRGETYSGVDGGGFGGFPKEHKVRLSIPISVGGTFFEEKVVEVIIKAFQNNEIAVVGSKVIK